MANQPLDLPSVPDKPKKPLVQVDDLRQFDPEFWAGRAHDPSWVEGYSQIVQANDIEASDDLDFQVAQRNQGGRIKRKEEAYALIGAKPQKLKYRLMWLPIARANGAALDAGSARMLRDYTEKQGYRPVMGEKKDGRITARILEEMGSTVSIDCRLAEDGTIRRGVGDIALYYTDGVVAQNWERYAAKVAAEADKPVLPTALSEGRFKAETFEDEEQRGKATYAD